MKTRLHSFRFRIAMLSTLFSALVLLAFALWTWRAAQHSTLRRIDESIRELGDRHLRMRQPPQYWRHATESLEFVLGDLRDNPFILLVKGRDGAVMHVSENWPDALPAEAYPTPVEAGFTEEPEQWGPPRDRTLTPPLPQGGRESEPPPFPQRGSLFQRGREFRPPPPPGMPPGPPRPMPVHLQEFQTVRTHDATWRIGVMSNPEVTFALGLNLAGYTADMDRLRRMFLLALPGALLLIAAAGWWLAQRALRPVKAITDTAETLTAQGLDQRIPLGEEDAEFDRLIRVFNGMLDRLQKSFQQAVRFSADAAHELKTPLTILQGELAQAVQSAPAGSDQQQIFNRLLEEVQRLKSITRKLLLLSQADSGQLKPQTAPVNLSEMVEAAGDDMRILAPKLNIQAGIEPDLWIRADADLFQQVIQNLASNAVKYSAPGGTIALELRKAGGNVRLRIGNTGPGIPPDEHGRVFERFYRADKARNRGVDGIGLGLSLAREIVRAHGGDLVLEEAREGWTAFVATVPAIDAPRH